MECLRRRCERWGSLSQTETDFGSIRRPKARVSSKLRLGRFSKKTETHCEQITLTEAKWVDFDRMKFCRKWDRGGGESSNPGHKSSNWGSPTPRKTQRLAGAWVCGEGMHSKGICWQIFNFHLCSAPKTCCLGFHPHLLPLGTKGILGTLALTMEITPGYKILSSASGTMWNLGINGILAKGPRMSAFGTRLVRELPGNMEMVLKCQHNIHFQGTFWMEWRWS